MEYPMMVNDVAYTDLNKSTKLTIHEIMHTYMPFYCGINESKYGWMDEGWATFGHFIITSDFIGEENAEFYFMPGYSDHKGYDMDLPMFAISNYLKRPVYHDNSYVKAAAFYLVLKNYLSDDLFREGLQAFMKRWRSRHPTPYDFFNTFNDVSKKNINWLVKPWFFEYGYVDLAIANARIQDNTLIINIEKKGKYPAPVLLKINYNNGRIDRIEKTVSVWEDGKTYLKISKEIDSKINSIELIDISRIDANLANNKLEMDD